MPAKKRKRVAIKVPPRTKTFTSSTVSLLDLPLELRQKIYRAFFQLKGLPPNCTQECSPRCRFHTRGFASILYASRQIHSEVWPIITEYRTFKFMEPLDLANTFLSFLPRQRLLGVKHLTLTNESWGRETFFYHFQRTWWCYLDVFSRLDTLTFEVFGIPEREFYHILPVMIGLLEQGGTKRPKWVDRKTYDYIRTPPTNLPTSHGWVIQFCQMFKTLKEDNWCFETLGGVRIVVQQNGGIKDHRPLDVFGDWVKRIPSQIPVTATHIETSFRSQFITCDDQAVESKDFSLFNDVCGPEIIKFKLGAQSRLLNDFTYSEPFLFPDQSGREHMVNTFDVLNIGGHWITKH